MAIPASSRNAIEMSNRAGYEKNKSMIESLRRVPTPVSFFFTDYQHQCTVQFQRGNRGASGGSQTVQGRP